MGTTLKETRVTKNKGNVYFISSVWKLLHITSYTLLTIITFQDTEHDGGADGDSELHKQMVYCICNWENTELLSKFHCQFCIQCCILITFDHSLLLRVLLLFSPIRLGKQESTVYRKGHPFLYCFTNSIIRRIPSCHISILYFNFFQATIVLLFVGHCEIGRIILKRILAKKFVMMWSGSMIIMFRFVAKGRLCDSGSSVNNNPCEPEKFHIFF